jgi:hypothetical protein
MKKYSPLLLIIFIFFFKIAKSQSVLDSIQLNKEFLNLEEAIKNPENVYRLNLSNQNLQIFDTIWSKFTNLQYLSWRIQVINATPSLFRVAF